MTKKANSSTVLYPRFSTVWWYQAVCCRLQYPSQKRLEKRGGPDTEAAYMVLYKYNLENAFGPNMTSTYFSRKAKDHNLIAIALIILPTV